MNLTEEEFKRIRPNIQWSMKEIMGRMYNTPITIDDTKLFWIDFLRNIFAHYFHEQWAVSEIFNFDYT